MVPTHLHACTRSRIKLSVTNRIIPSFQNGVHATKVIKGHRHDEGLPISLCLTLQPEHSAKTVPFSQACGLTLLVVVSPHRLHVNWTWKHEIARSSDCTLHRVHSEELKELVTPKMSTHGGAYLPCATGVPDRWLSIILQVGHGPIQFGPHRSKTSTYSTHSKGQTSFHSDKQISHVVCLKQRV